MLKMQIKFKCVMQPRVSGNPQHTTNQPQTHACYSSFLHASSRFLCRPALSKFDLSNHDSNPRFTFGQSESSIEYQAVSRLWPRAIICCRNVPSYTNPRRSAALLDGALRSLHFHSYLRNLSSSNTYRARRYIASVAAGVRCSAGVNKMFPTSMTRFGRSIRISDAIPIACAVFPGVALTLMVYAQGLEVDAFVASCNRKVARESGCSSKR